MKIFALLCLLLPTLALASGLPVTAIYDSAGNSLTSTGGSLNVAVTSGGGGGGGTVNPAGSFAQNTAVGGTAVTLTAPAHAVGFLLEASSSNTQNLRFAVGSAAAASAGIRLEPGRDSGWIPIAANVSVIAESGSGQEVDIQWALSQ